MLQAIIAFDCLFKNVNPYSMVNAVCLLCLLHILLIHTVEKNTLEVNTMNPDQTALRAVYSGSILFAIQAIKVHKQMKCRRQLSGTVGKMVNTQTVIS